MKRYEHLVTGEGQRFADMTVVAEREALRVTGSDGLFQRLKLSGKTEIVDPDNPPRGMSFQGTAHDHRVEDVFAQNFRMRLAPTAYWQGDGLGTEALCRRIHFLRCTAKNNTEAGFDLKAADSTLTHCTALGNARNFRFWASHDCAGVTTSLDPIKRGGTGLAYGLGAYQRAVVRIERLVARGRSVAPLFCFDLGGGTFEIADYELDLPAEALRCLVTNTGVGGEVRWGRKGAPRGWQGLVRK